MPTINTYAAPKAKSPLAPFKIERRNPGPNDVVIDIQYCGICHSDIHLARDEWGRGNFPMVPGHEIVGIVSQVGNAVTKYKVGDKVGVGCFVDSCRACTPCKEGIEQYCEKGMTLTYNSFEKDGKTLTYGGYSTQIVVDENYVLRIPDSIPLQNAAPLLCAGITTYSPLKHWDIKKGDVVGVIGLGGLGHMAVKIAAAMGAHVIVFSTSDSKKADALKFGAKEFVNTKTQDAIKNHEQTCDLLINTVSDNIDLALMSTLLKLNGTMVLVGLPEDPNTPINVRNLIFKRRAVAGSVIGGIKETQEMLDFCAKHNIAADIELIPADKINDAYERTIKSDVRYRFVIDIKTMK